MKNVYDALNDVKEDIDNIELVDFSNVEEYKYMKNFKKNIANEKICSDSKIKLSKCSIAVASLAICTVLASTVYAKDIIKFVNEKLSIGGASIVVYDEQTDIYEKDIVTNLLLGKVYDEKGKLYKRDEIDLTKKVFISSVEEEQVEKILVTCEEGTKEYNEIERDLKNSFKLYDKDGKEIVFFEILDENGELCEPSKAKDIKLYYELPEEYRIETKLVDSNSNGEKEYPGYVLFHDEEKAKEYALINIMFPSSLPEGFTLKNIRFLEPSGDEKEAEESKKYMFADYVNKTKNQRIFIHERMDGPEYGYETGAKDAEYITIKGEKAILADDTIYVTVNNTICSIQGNNVLKEELINIAESLR